MRILLWSASTLVWLGASWGLGWGEGGTHTERERDTHRETERDRDRDREENCHEPLACRARVCTSSKLIREDSHFFFSSPSSCPSGEGGRGLSQGLPQKDLKQAFHMFFVEKKRECFAHTLIGWGWFRKGRARALLGSRQVHTRGNKLLGPNEMLHICKMCIISCPVPLTYLVYCLHTNSSSEIHPPNEQASDAKFSTEARCSRTITTAAAAATTCSLPYNCG